MLMFRGTFSFPRVDFHPTRTNYWQLLAVTGSYWQLLAVTGSYWQLLAVTDSFPDTSESTGSYWQLLAVTGSYWQLLAVTGSYWQLLAVTGIYCCAPRRSLVPFYLPSVKDARFWLIVVFFTSF
jgi:hypothetical protein